MRRFIQDTIDGIFGHLEAVLDDLFGVEALQDDLDEPTVHRVSDSATVVGLSCHVVQGLIGDVLILVQEHLQLQLGNGEIGCCKLVGNVPSQWTVPLPKANDGDYPENSTSMPD